MPDGRMVRAVRLQLIAWSAGSTLVVLVVLGALLYAAVAMTLASSSENLLRDRAALLAASAAGGPAGSTDGGIRTTTAVIGRLSVVSGGDAGLPGFAVAGPYAGTLAVVVPIDGTTGLDGAPSITATGSATAVSGSADGAGPDTAAPDPAGYAAAEAGATTVRETTWLGSPVRVLSIPIVIGAATEPAGVIQVVGDRGAELRTLGMLLAVLVGGGLLALVAATIVGSMYATRALVPIRESLRRQRELAADTSHELRTPLAVIRAGVARVRQQPEARVADVAPALDAIDADVARLGSLVDDLLTLARTDAGTTDLDVRPTDLAEVAADALDALEPLAAGRGTRLELDVEPAPMVGDVERLRRLVTVLADNAIRHGRAGGVVRVTVRSGRLCVEDDGAGIAPEDRAHVFDRFWRGAGASAGGSGLGLAIAAWVVERHRGHVTVGTSDLGGARFDVTLPTG